ncbi:MAG: hypothetical protein R2880_15725 [Deinococcales bacterium]
MGEGVADIPACIEALKTINYQGVIGIEHEPEDRDPTPEVLASKARLEAWLS